MTATLVVMLVVCMIALGAGLLAVIDALHAEAARRRMGRVGRRGLR